MSRRKHPAIAPNAIMALIIEAARKGERCPIASHRFPSQMTSMLANQGRIRVDIYPHNYRVITITEPGQHFGQATAPPPNPNWKPYLTLPSTHEKPRG